VTDDDVQARLAAQLKELRLAAGLGGIEAGRRAQPPMSQSKLSKLERQLLRPSPADVAALCDVYGAAAGQREEMIGLAESLRTDVIEPSRITLSRGAQYIQQRIRRLEESVTLLRSFQPTMVIGLLQTPAYASVVFGAAVSGEDVDQAVAARVERQVQMRDRVPRAVLIMTEGALRWPGCGPQAMAEQIDAIIAATELPNVDLGIIPFSAPAAGIFPRHGFHLYDSDAVIVGTESGMATITDADDIGRYERMFGRLQEIASTGGAARDALARIAADYRNL
jgi:transcriptional regulator with XRE-family HTH domain